MKQRCQLIMQGLSSMTALRSPGPLSFTPSAPFLSNLWQQLRLGHNFTKHNISFLQESSAAWANGFFVSLPLQSAESPLSPSAVSHSDSASSTQSLSHGGAPELLVGLSYNATTGRLSVEMIKGSHFRNLAVSRAPGKCMSVPPALLLPGAPRKLCLLSS